MVVQCEGEVVLDEVLAGHAQVKGVPGRGKGIGQWKMQRDALRPGGRSCAIQVRAVQGNGSTVLEQVQFPQYCDSPVFKLAAHAGQRLDRNGAAAAARHRPLEEQVVPHLGGGDW